RESDFTCVLDPLLRQRLNRGARLGWGLTQVDLPRRDHPRADDFTFLHTIAQCDVRLGWSATCKHRGVPGLDQRLHLRGVEVVHMLVTIDKSGHSAHALCVDDLESLR